MVFLASEVGLSISSLFDLAWQLNLCKRYFGDMSVHNSQSVCFPVKYVHA